MIYKRKFKKLILCLVIINIYSLIFFNNSVLAKGEKNNKDEAKNKENIAGILKKQSDSIGINNFIEEANKYKNEDLDIDLNEAFSLAIKGNVDNNKIFKKIISILGKEIKNTVNTIGSILVIIIISSVIRSISDNLDNKSSVSQITYYVIYILIVTLIMKNFSEIIVIMKDSINSLVGFSNNLIPLLITLMITTGNFASAGMLEPIILVMITFIGNFINMILIPISLIAVSLNVISNLSDKIKIDKIPKYINSSIIWILGIILTVFVGITSLEGSITNGVDALTVKTTKAAVSNFVPIVGKILR